MSVTHQTPPLMPAHARQQTAEDQACSPAQADLGVTRGVAVGLSHGAVAGRALALADRRSGRTPEETAVTSYTSLHLHTPEETAVTSYTSLHLHTKAHSPVGVVLLTLRLRRHLLFQLQFRNSQRKELKRFGLSDCHWMLEPLKFLSCAVSSSRRTAAAVGDKHLSHRQRGQISGRPTLNPILDPIISAC